MNIWKRILFLRFDTFQMSNLKNPKYSFYFDWFMLIHMYESIQIIILDCRYTYELLSVQFFMLAE